MYGWLPSRQPCRRREAHGRHWSQPVRRSRTSTCSDAARSRQGQRVQSCRARCREICWRELTFLDLTMMAGENMSLTRTDPWLPSLGCESGSVLSIDSNGSSSARSMRALPRGSAVPTRSQSKTVTSKSAATRERTSTSNFSFHVGARVLPKVRMLCQHMESGKDRAG